MRLCRRLGKTLAELRAAILPGELELHQADAQLNGPWWEVRSDYHAAAGVQALYATVSEDPPALGDCLINWNPPPMTVLGFDELAARIMAGRKKGGSRGRVDR